MCTADSAHKHTVQTFSSASNAKSSTLIPCFPQREKERGTERPFSSSDSYGSQLVDGLIEERGEVQRDTDKERKRHRFWKMKLPHSLSAGEDWWLELHLALALQASYHSEI